MTDNNGHKTIRTANAADASRRKEMARSKLVAHEQHVAAGKSAVKQQRTRGAQRTQAQAEIADYLRRNPVKYW